MIPTITRLCIGCNNFKANNQP